MDELELIILYLYYNINFKIKPRCLGGDSYMYVKKHVVLVHRILFY